MQYIPYKNVVGVLYAYLSPAEYRPFWAELPNEVHSNFHYTNCFRSGKLKFMFGIK